MTLAELIAEARIAFIYLWIVNFFCLMILGYLLYYGHKLRRSHPTLHKLTDPVLILIIPMIIINIALFVSRTTMILNRNELIYNHGGSFAFAYSAYFFFMVLGLNRFLRGVVRLPEKAMRRFTFIGKMMYFLSVIAVFLGFISFTVKDNPLELLFAIISIFTMGAFIYYLRVLKQESIKNASMLMRARIDMLAYVIRIQIISGLILVLGNLVLSFDLFPSDESELVLFALISILLTISAVILILSINIPNYVRKQYNITPTRFRRIAKVEGRDN